MGSRNNPDSSDSDEDDSQKDCYVGIKQGEKDLPRLDEYCEKYRIAIFGEMGSRVCCAQKLWKTSSQVCIIIYIRNLG
jgi:hypothetical protein